MSFRIVRRETRIGPPPMRILVTLANGHERVLQASPMDRESALRYIARWYPQLAGKEQF